MKKVFFLFLIFFSSVYAGSGKKLPTYFHYSADEVDEISDAHSECMMSIAEVLHWESVIEKLNEEKKLKNDLYRLKAYLYTAQSDAAFLSMNCHHECVGSLHPISHHVLKLFLENLPDPPSFDAYSEKLAEIVMSKITARFQEEKAKIRPYPLKENDPKLMDFPKPLKGLETASWKPWILKDPTQIPLNPPSTESGFWKKECERVKEELSQNSQAEQEIVLFWEGGCGPGSGSWLKLTDDYMLQKGVPLPKFLYIHSILAQAGVDCDIAVYFQKYTYAIPRPWMTCKEIKPEVPLPHHPSYPSSHAAFSAMYATLLCHFFPSGEEIWFRHARDAALSRVWGGLHFPIDTAEGRKFGIKIGNEILISIRNKCF